MVTSCRLAGATLTLVTSVALLAGCGSGVLTEQLEDAGRGGTALPRKRAEAGMRRDAGTGAFVDAALPPVDTGTVGPFDATDTGTFPHDTGVPHVDAGHRDAGPARHDSGFDAGYDGGHDRGHDSGHDGGHVTELDSGHDSGPITKLDSGFDAGVDSAIPDSGWVIAAHYPMPQIIDFGGNTSVDPTGVITSPVFIAVTFLNYDLTAEAQNFVATVGATSYWTDVVAEYGVGPAQAGTPIELPETAPGPGLDGGTIDDIQIQAWLESNFDGASANAVWGTPNDSTVYFIAYPSDVTVTLDGLTSCINGGFGGYHNSVLLTSGPYAGQNVTYAVLPECSIEASTAQSLTMSGSHELIEATTDPLPQTNYPTYIQVDQNDIVWELVVGGGEIADMCAQVADAFFQPAGYAYSVQRAWSNEHAAAGHDPCQPSPVGQHFINATASLLDMGPVNLAYTQPGTSGPPENIETEGLSIPLNTSKTIEIRLYSDGPVPDWNVYPSDLSENGSGTYLNFSTQMLTGNNGSILELTITPLAVNPGFGGEPFILFSQDTGMVQTNFWVGYIANN